MSVLREMRKTQCEIRCERRETKIAKWVDDNFCIYDHG